MTLVYKNVPDVGQLLIDALNFGFFALTVANVGNEDSLENWKKEVTFKEGFCVILRSRFKHATTTTVTTTNQKL